MRIGSAAGAGERDGAKRIDAGPKTSEIDDVRGCGGTMAKRVAEGEGRAFICFSGQNGGWLAGLLRHVLVVMVTLGRAKRGSPAPTLKTKTRVCSLADHSSRYTQGDARSSENYKILSLILMDRVTLSATYFPWSRSRERSLLLTEHSSRPTDFVISVYYMYLGYLIFSTPLLPPFLLPYTTTRDFFLSSTSSTDN